MGVAFSSFVACFVAGEGRRGERERAKFVVEKKSPARQGCLNHVSEGNAEGAVGDAAAAELTPQIPMSQRPRLGSSLAYTLREM